MDREKSLQVPERGDTSRLRSRGRHAHGRKSACADGARRGRARRRCARRPGGARDRARRGGSGLGHLRAHEARGVRGGRHRVDPPRAAGVHPGGGHARARGAAERRPARDRDPHAAPAAGADRRGPRHQRDRPDEGRGRLPSRERRLPPPGPPDACRRDALGRDGDPARLRRGAEGRPRGRDRPLEHRRQADGAPPAGRARDCDDRAQPHARPRGRRPGGRRARRGGRPSGHRHGRDGEARRHGDRRRNQPRGRQGARRRRPTTCATWRVS